MAAKSQFEYKVARATGNDLSTPDQEASFLDGFGQDGWELVAVTTGTPMSYYFRREKEDFRSRVTIEQKVRVYAERGVDVAAQALA